MKQKALIFTLVLASVALAVFVFRRQSSGPAMNLRPSVAVGELLAEETSRLLGGKGNIVVIGRASVKEGQSAANEQITALGAALRRRASPKLAATEWLPQRPRMTMNASDLTAEQLVALLEKHPEANAFVVFAGLPPLSPPLAEKLTARSLNLLAVCGYGTTVRRWLEAHVLAAAVVPRLGELPPGTPPLRRRLRTGSARNSRCLRRRASPNCLIDQVLHEYGPPSGAARAPAQIPGSTPSVIYGRMTRNGHCDQVSVRG